MTFRDFHSGVEKFPRKRTEIYHRMIWGAEILRFQPPRTKLKMALKPQAGNHDLEFEDRLKGRLG